MSVKWWLASMFLVCTSAGAEPPILNPDDFGGAPVLGEATPSVPAERQLAPPTQRNQCVSKQARSEALSAGVCDCSCEAYASNWTDRCDLVCGVEWYACWAPRPADEDVIERYMKGYETFTEGDMDLIRDSLDGMLSDPDMIEQIRQGFLMEDGLEWENARTCP